ncbi:MAG: amidohydrolase [Fimbriimonadales bacterium]|nr:MAG: amidohydrolase [Fimbriimonadales bacterium]
MVYALLFAMALCAPADLVVENARIWTGDAAGFASFLAVRDGRFVHVGDPRPDLIGPRTERIDAEGRVVLPGFIDSHIHMLNGGMNLSQLQLRDAASKEEFIQRVRDWAASLPEGKWILGGRWSTESWAVVEQPTKEWVDEASQGHPLYLSRMDGHSALVNSVALRMAGITKDTPNPPGGVIDKDPRTGEPTGILRETAMGLVSRLIPPPTIEEKVEALRRAMREANQVGITSVCDIPSFSDLPVYERLAAEGDLTVRFLLYPTADDWSEAIRRLATWRGKEGWVEVQGFKAYFDGSLGSRTAWMSKPFLNNPADQPNWAGLPMPIVTDGTFLRNARAAAAGGYQVIVHAIGDEANRVLAKQLLDVYGSREMLRRARPRSEHAQHLAPDVVSAFGNLGIIASMQPYHKADDGRYAEEYIGAERCAWSYAYRKLLNAGAVVAFGSDWPVVTQNVFLGLEAAVDARILNGKIWFPEERLPITEALRGYTTSAAYACFMESEIGRIAPGYRADFQVLNGSPFANEVRWQEIRPVQVFVEGKRVL